MGRGSRAANAHITDALRSSAQGTPKWLEVRDDGGEALAVLMSRPAGPQPWMRAASRFRGGRGNWDWAPEQMREIARSVQDGADERSDDPANEVVFLVGGYDDGQGPGSEPRFVVFEYGFDEIGEREIFMYGAARTLTQANDLFAQAARDVTGADVSADAVRDRLAALLA